MTSKYSDFEFDASHPKEVQFEGSEYKRSEENQSEDDESGGGQSEGGIKGLDPFTLFGADDSIAGQDTQGVFSGQPMHDPQYVQRVALAPAFGPANMPNVLNPSPNYAPSPTPAQSIKYMQGYTQQPTSSQPTPGGPRVSPTPRPFSTGGEAPPGEE
jgi:hypothetical protein